MTGSSGESAAKVLVETCVSPSSIAPQRCAGRGCGGVQRPAGLWERCATGRHPCQMKGCELERERLQEQGTRPMFCAQGLAPTEWHRTGPGIASLAPSSTSWTARRPQGIPVVTDMLHYGYYFAVWPQGVRQRGWESGFIVFQGSEEAFMSQRRGTKQLPLACLLVGGLFFLFFLLLSPRSFSPLLR